MKKFLSLTLAVIMVLSCFGVAFATEIEKESQSWLDVDEVVVKTQNLLSQIELYKNQYGLQGVDFSNLVIQNTVALFEATEDGLIGLPITYLLIQEGNDNIIGIVIVSTDSGGKPRVEFTTEFVDVFNPIKDSKIEVVYDENKMIVFSNDEVALVNNNDPVLSRVNLDFTELQQQVLMMDEPGLFSEKVDLVISQSTTRDATTSRLLNVPKYKQTSGSQYCWACSLVSVGGYYFPSISLNPRTVAINHAGDIYTGKTLAETRTIMNSEYPMLSNGYNFSYQSTNLKFAQVTASLNAGNPIIAREAALLTSYGHVVVINGYSTNTVDKTYTMMDPLSGTYRTGSVDSSNNLMYTDINTAVITYFRDSLRIM